MGLLTQFCRWLTGLFRREPVRLAVVRRYADANGSLVGELYVEGTFSGVSAYRMVGVSLDTLPYGVTRDDAVADELDTDNDFLAPMPPNTLRVGATDPRDNETVRRMVARLPRRGMTLLVQNRFIEHVMESGKA